MISPQAHDINQLDNLTPLPLHYRDYYHKLYKDLDSLLNIAVKARSKGFDPSLSIEAEVALDLPDRVEHLLKLPIASRLRELLSKFRTERAALIIAEEIALGKFGFLSTEDALNQAIRAGLAVVTDGVTVAPLQGISSIKIKKNDDGTSHLAIYFAGPIRSAGGTEAAFTLVIADYLRKIFGIDNYRPNLVGEDEVGRFIEELRIYEREVGNFQYKVSDKDLEFALYHLPVEINGVETDPVEVVVHRGLKRVETDRVRGGALRVLNDGIIGRSRKLLQLTRDLSIRDWEWLSELDSAKQLLSDDIRGEESHFSEVISGRPVLSTPNRLGGFRLRYGRCYNTGLATVGIHPIISILLDYPIVTGTQVKMDIPGKAATIAFVDTIDTPIVRLKDRSVVKIESVEEAEEIRDKVDKILYLGDVLISFGDFLENNVTLPPSPYVEEWWCQDLKLCMNKKFQSIEACANAIGIATSRLEDFLLKPLIIKPNLSEAFLLSELLGVPLHPKYLFYWDTLSPQEILILRQNLTVVSNDLHSCKLTIPDQSNFKEILEKLGVPHQIDKNLIKISGESAYILIKILKLGEDLPVISGWKDVTEMLSLISGIPIRKKVSVFVGMRVGRPEKAMPRKMKPPVHVLFPVGLSGGSKRDIMQAAKKVNIKVDLINLVCNNCGSNCISVKCPHCGGDVHIERKCPLCGRVVTGELCSSCKVAGQPFSLKDFPLKQSLEMAINRVKYQPSPPLKGVQGLTNPTRIPEPLEKGLLRQKYGLFVYKDGTIRFDVTNAPLTHFYPYQIGTPIEKLRELGYEKDVYGKPLESENQLLEIYAQDIILPIEAGEYLVKVAKFIDDLLVNFYGEPPCYNVKSKEDLIGHLVLGLAPHTSAGIVGRIIGFTNAQVCFAHPYWHSAKRRDCDGDQDSIILLLDVLINFSRDYLPAQIGGLMDAPLLIQPIIIPNEVQRQAHNIDIASHYPLEFYNATLQTAPPNKLVEFIDIVRKRLKDEKQFYNFGFTHHTTQITLKRSRSSYSTLESLLQKLENQIELAMKIKSVDPNEVVSSVLKTHILPDIVGNIKAYTTQSIRCKLCGAQYRRYPLKGSCLSCGGELQPTVMRGSVEKYLQLGLNLCKRFEVGEYLRERFEIISDELSTLFAPKEVKIQKELTDYI
ncbi:MAG: DNA polymerase II large subunit [Nitrososphaerales archaeon]